MRNAVLLNKGRKKRKSGRKRKSSARQRAYLACVKKAGGVTEGARLWRKRGMKAAANTRKRKKRRVKRATPRRAKRAKRRPRRNVLSLARRNVRRNVSRRRKPRRRARRNMAMTRSWKSALKRGVSRRRSAPRGWTRKRFTSWKRSIARMNPVTALAKEIVSVESLKTGVPVVMSGLLGYMVPYYLGARFSLRAWKRHIVGAGTALVAGLATGYVSKKPALGIAAMMSAAAGYLIPVFGPPLVAKLLPAPEAVTVTGLLGQGDDAIERGIQEAISEAGLGYSEADVAEAESLGYGEEAFENVPSLGRSSEFGLGARGRF